MLPAKKPGGERVACVPVERDGRESPARMHAGSRVGGGGGIGGDGGGRDAAWQRGCKHPPCAPQSRPSVLITGSLGNCPLVLEYVFSSP